MNIRRSFFSNAKEYDNTEEAAFVLREEFELAYDEARRRGQTYGKTLGECWQIELDNAVFCFGLELTRCIQ